MFCKYCGKEISDDTSVCPYCGGNLENRLHEYSNELVPEPVQPKKKSELAKKFRIFFVIVVLSLLYDVVYAINSATSDTLYIVTSSAGQSMEVKYPIYYVTIYILFGLTILILLLKLFATIKNLKLSVYMKYALFTTLVYILLLAANYFGIFGSGILSSIAKIFYSVLDSLFIICITKVIREYAVKEDRQDLVEKTDSYLRLFIIFTIVAALLFGRLYIAIDILYIILLNKAMKQL